MNSPPQQRDTRGVSILQQPACHEDVAGSVQGQATQPDPALASQHREAGGTPRAAEHAAAASVESPPYQRTKSTAVGAARLANPDAEQRTQQRASATHVASASTSLGASTEAGNADATLGANAQFPAPTCDIAPQAQQAPLREQSAKPSSRFDAQAHAGHARDQGAAAAASKMRAAEKHAIGATPDSSPGSASAREQHKGASGADSGSEDAYGPRGAGSDSQNLADTAMLPHAAALPSNRNSERSPRVASAESSRAQEHCNAPASAAASEAAQHAHAAAANAQGPATRSRRRAQQSAVAPDAPGGAAGPALAPPSTRSRKAAEVAASARAPESTALTQAATPVRLRARAWLSLLEEAKSRGGGKALVEFSEGRLQQAHANTLVIAPRSLFETSLTRLLDAQNEGKAAEYYLFGLANRKALTMSQAATSAWTTFRWKRMAVLKEVDGVLSRISEFGEFHRNSHVLAQCQAVPGALLDAVAAVAQRVRPVPLYCPRKSA